MLTWSELAEAIFNMPEEVKKKLAVMQDTNTGEIVGFDEVSYDEDLTCYLLDQSDEDVDD